MIVGASLAGAKAAETLRAEGFDGRLVLIGAERRAPVRAPAAVEGVPARRGRAREGLRARRGLLRRARHRAAARPHRGRPGHGARASSTLDDGERLRYDRLLLATGAEPRRLPIPGADLDGVHYLRSVEDSDALRERLDRGGARRRGRRRLDRRRGRRVGPPARAARSPSSSPLAVPLERVLGAEVGAIYRDIHADHGVRMLLGTGVEALRGRRRRVERVRTSDGRTLDCDFVVVGVGVAAAHRARRQARPRRRQRHPRRRAPADQRAGRLRRRRRRQRPPPVLRRARSASSTGPTRSTRGRVAARDMLGRDDAYDRAAVLLLRPVRRRHGVLGLRARVGPGRVPRRPREPRVHRVLAARRSRRRRDERQRLGRHRPDPARSSASASRSTTGGSRTPTCRSTRSPRADDIEISPT